MFIIARIYSLLFPLSIHFLCDTDSLVCKEIIKCAFARVILIEPDLDHILRFLTKQNYNWRK